jgi:hypothetical protein
MWIKYCRAVGLASVTVYGTAIGFLPSSLSCSPRLRIVALTVLCFEPYSGSKQYGINNFSMFSGYSEWYLLRCYGFVMIFLGFAFRSEFSSCSRCGSFFGSCMTFFLSDPDPQHCLWLTDPGGPKTYWSRSVTLVIKIPVPIIISFRTFNCWKVMIWISKK